MVAAAMAEPYNDSMQHSGKHIRASEIEDLRLVGLSAADTYRNSTRHCDTSPGQRKHFVMT